jgi:hypothetical protein
MQHGGEGIEGNSAGGSDSAPGSFGGKTEVGPLGVAGDIIGRVSGQVGNGIGGDAQLGAGLGAKVGSLSASAAGAAAVGAGAGEPMITHPQNGGMRHRRRSVKRRSPKRKSHKRSY